MKIINEESQANIDAFKQKYGEEAYPIFSNNLQRLRNLGIRVDIPFHLANTSVEEMKNILNRVQNYHTDKQLVKSTGSEDHGDYEYIGEGNGYKVYKVNDAKASFYLGKNTGWCIAGRWHHYGDEASASFTECQKHWNTYEENGKKFIFFLGPKKWALEYFPWSHQVEINSFTSNHDFISEGNFKLWNQQDNQDLNGLAEIPLNLVYKYLDLTMLPVSNGVVLSKNGKELVAVDPNLSEVVIPNGVVEIRLGIFGKNVRSIKLPDSVCSIGTYAFKNCINLTNIDLGKSLTTIGARAFFGCKSLQTIYIPDSVTEIKRGAFRDCASLVNIHLPSNLSILQVFTFARCTKLQEIYIPDNVKVFERSVFNECEALKKCTSPGIGGGIKVKWFDNSDDQQTIPIEERDFYMQHIEFQDR